MYAFAVYSTPSATKTSVHVRSFLLPGARPEESEPAVMVVESVPLDEVVAPIEADEQSLTVRLLTEVALSHLK